jgi:hypothetical protein
MPSKVCAKTFKNFKHFQKLSTYSFDTFDKQGLIAKADPLRDFLQQR